MQWGLWVPLDFQQVSIRPLEKPCLWPVFGSKILDFLCKIMLFPYPEVTLDTFEFLAGSHSAARHFMAQLPKIILFGNPTSKRFPFPLTGLTHYQTALSQCTVLSLPITLFMFHVLSFVFVIVLRAPDVTASYCQLPGLLSSFSAQKRAPCPDAQRLPGYFKEHFKKENILISSFQSSSSFF